jgi:hypothetical protein
MTVSAERLTKFTINDQSVPVLFVETQTVKDGVECDIYAFVGDDSKDLAIVRVKKGYKTPLQKVLLGNKTVEGFVRGSGVLTVNNETYAFGSELDNKEVVVSVGQTMQWYANAQNDLTFYEICEPPYSDGRFENLPEQLMLS